jgi:hypothetical protein
MGYINNNGDYHEGDRQCNDLEVPQRPGIEYMPSYNQDGSFNCWVIDADKKAAVIEAKYQAEINNCLSLILTAIGTGGATQETKITALQTKITELKAKMNTETEALYSE